MSTPESEIQPTNHTPSTESAPGSASGGPPRGDDSARPARRLIRIYVVVAVVIVVAMILVAYALTGGFAPSNSSKTDVLVPSRTVDVIPAGQFDAIALEISSTASINGSFFVTFALTIYTMTPTQFQSFIRTGKLDGYEWTSGPVHNDSVYTLGVSISPGAWDLVFDNPSLINATAIGFYTDLTLTPG